jgi:hypothetical protein
MWRYVLPYLIVASGLSIATGAVYGAGLIGVPGMYAGTIGAVLVGMVGFDRWERQPRSRRGRQHSA